VTGVPDVSGPAPRLDALTGIRFVAAIAVFNAHVIPPADGPAILATVSLAGHDWMTMFFILSGLILVWNYDAVIGDRLTGPGLRTYYVARLARIYPLYLLALALAVIPSVTSGADVAGLLTDPRFWQHVVALQTWSGDLSVAYGFNPPAWSIGVEFFLYALFPLLLVAIRPIRQSPRALVAVAAAAILVAVAITLVLVVAGLAELPRTDPHSAHRWIYRTPLTRIPDFVLGMSLGYLIMLSRSRSMKRVGVVVQGIGAALVVGSMLIAPLVESVWSLDVAAMIPFALVMLGLVWAPRTGLARLLSTRLCVFLGEVSFAFYLLHVLVISAVGQPRGDGVVAWAASWIAAFALTLFAAAGAHMLVERPARVAIRAALDRRAKTAPPPT